MNWKKKKKTYELFSWEEPVCHEFPGSDGHCLVRHFCWAPTIGETDLLSSTTPQRRRRRLEFNPAFLKTLVQLSFSLGLAQFEPLFSPRLILDAIFLHLNRLSKMTIIPLMKKLNKSYTTLGQEECVLILGPQNLATIPAIFVRAHEYISKINI